MRVSRRVAFFKTTISCAIITMITQNKDQNIPLHPIHDTPTKNRLIGAIESGLSVAKAAELVGMPKSTAYDIKNKFKKTGSTANLRRSGRPKKLSEAGKRLIVRNAIKARCKPFRELANELQLDVSASTIRRVLDEKGYHRRVARKCPYLRKDQKQARQRWAKQYEQWTDEDWARVIFSDESYIYLDNGRGREYVTCRADEVLHEDCVVPTFKQSPVRVMVWGCIIAGQKGPLVVLEYPGGKGSGMNSERYREQVLDHVLVDFHTQLKASGGIVYFQQDNAPSHTSKSTKSWFTAHNIPLLFHPSSSPDLNPIEPVWHELKSLLRALPHPPSTVEALKEAVLHAWDELSVAHVDKHISGMHDRVEAILAAKGGHTNF